MSEMKQEIGSGATPGEVKLWNEAISAAYEAAITAGKAYYDRWKTEPEWAQPYAANRIYGTATEIAEAVRALYRKKPRACRKAPGPRE